MSRSRLEPNSRFAGTSVHSRARLSQRDGAPTPRAAIARSHFAIPPCVGLRVIQVPREDVPVPHALVPGPTAPRDEMAWKRSQRRLEKGPSPTAPSLPLLTRL